MATSGGPLVVLCRLVGLVHIACEELHCACWVLKLYHSNVIMLDFRLVLRKSKRKLAITSRRLVTTLLQLHLCQSLAGMGIICWSTLTRCRGSRDGQLSARRVKLKESASLKLWMPFFPPADLLKNPFVFLYR